MKYNIFLQGSRKRTILKMNDASFEYLYKKYLDRIVRFINVQYRMDIETSKDIAHDTFKTMWEKREELYDEDEKMMLSWLYETAKRKSWEYNKKQNKLVVYFNSDLEEISNDFSDEYEDLLHIESFISVDEKYQSYLKEIKKSLTKNERELFTLAVEKKLDPKAAAAALNISDVNFRVRLHRLRNKLDPIVKKMIEK